MRSKVTKLILQ